MQRQSAAGHTHAHPPTHTHTISTARPVPFRPPDGCGCISGPAPTTSLRAAAPPPRQRLMRTGQHQVVLLVLAGVGAEDELLLGVVGVRDRFPVLRRSTRTRVTRTTEACPCPLLSPALAWTERRARTHARTHARSHARSLAGTHARSISRGRGGWGGAGPAPTGASAPLLTGSHCTVKLGHSSACVMTRSAATE